MPPEPTKIQQEALAALVASRESGYRRGLVVLATGLGKTWLAAFDAVRPAIEAEEDAVSVGRRRRIDDVVKSLGAEECDPLRSPCCAMHSLSARGR